EPLGHVGHHKGLADGLTASDRESLVGISDVDKLRADEMLARHLVHRAQHGLIGDAALAQAQHELHSLDFFVAWRLWHLRPLSPMAPCYFRSSASLVMNGSSVMSMRSGVTVMRLSMSAETSVLSAGGALRMRT